MEIKNILFSYIKSNIFQIFYLIIYFLLFPKIQTLPNTEFIQGTTLINDSIFIIEKNNGGNLFANIYNQYWKKIETITNLNNFNIIEIEKFTEENFDLIIIALNYRIYIFNNTGNLLLTDENNLNGDYYNIIPIEKNERENNYTYAITFIQNNNNLKLEFFTYDYKNKSNELIHEIDQIEFENRKLELQDKIFSCQLMSQLNKNETIVCFYQANINNEILLGSFYVDTKNYSITFQKNITQHNSIKFLKSVVNYEKNKSLICFGSDESNKCNCTIYSFENDSFSELKEYDFHCKNDYHLSKFYYINKTGEFLFYCSDGENITLARFDKNFNIIGKNNTSKISGYNNLKYFSILYLNNSDYYIISNFAPNHFNKTNITIYIIDNNDDTETSSINNNVDTELSSTNYIDNNDGAERSLTNKYHNSITSLIISSSLYSSIINKNSSYDINSVNISSTYSSYSIFPTNQYSTEETSLNNSKNISFYNITDSIEISSLNSNIINNSHYIIYSSFISPDGTLPSSQYIIEDTIYIKKEI